MTLRQLSKHFIENHLWTLPAIINSVTFWNWGRVGETDDLVRADHSASGGISLPRWALWTGEKVSNVDKLRPQTWPTGAPALATSTLGFLGWSCVQP